MSMAPLPTPLQLPSILVEVSLSKSQTQLSSSSTVRALPYLYTLACVQENTLIAILLRWGLLMCVKVNLFLTHGWIVQPSLCIYCVGVWWSSQSSSSVWVYSGLCTHICTPLQLEAGQLKLIKTPLGYSTQRTNGRNSLATQWLTSHGINQKVRAVLYLLSVCLCIIMVLLCSQITSIWPPTLFAYWLRQRIVEVWIMSTLTEALVRQVHITSITNLLYYNETLHRMLRTLWSMLPLWMDSWCSVVHIHSQ